MVLFHNGCYLCLRIRVPTDAHSRQQGVKVAIENRERRIYALQYHPEVCFPDKLERGCGANFIDQVKYHRVACAFGRLSLCIVTENAACHFANLCPECVRFPHSLPGDEVSERLSIT